MHKKQSGGSGQFADVALRFEPGEPGTGFTFKSEIKGGAVPKEYIPGVMKVCTRVGRGGAVVGRGGAWLPWAALAPCPPAPCPPAPCLCP